MNEYGSELLQIPLRMLDEGLGSLQATPELLLTTLALSIFIIAFVLRMSAQATPFVECAIPPEGALPSSGAPAVADPATKRIVTSTSSGAAQGVLGAKTPGGGE